MRMLASLVSAVLVLAFSGGCGVKAPPNLTPAKTTAFYAYKGLAEVNIATKMFVELEAAHTPGFTQARTAQVVIASYKANVEGQKLADLLEEYDNLTDKTVKLSKQEAILLQLTLFEKAAKELAGVDFGTSLPATLAKTVTLVFDQIAQIRLALAQFKSATVLHFQPVGGGTASTR